MDERVMEIVLYIVDSINSTTEENILSQIKDISDSLTERGYTENEIKSAFDILMESLVDDEPHPAGDIHNNEHSSETVEKKPAPQAKEVKKQKHFIYQVNELDIVGEEEIEKIIDQSILRGKYGTSISEIKAMINNFLFDPGDLQSNSFFVINQKHYGH